MPSNKRVSTLAPDGTALMPTKASRARRWLQTGKAKVIQNDLEIFAIQLVSEPSGYQTQDIACGLDPGSDFTGIAVQSKHETLQGLNLNLPRKQVSKRMLERAVLRRTRRSRRIKRSLAFKQRNHRSKRFDNRRKSKLSPSIRANKQLELRVVKELLAIYPITHFYVERLTKSDSPGFTRAAQGQTFLIDQLLTLGQVVLVEGWETSITRQHLGLPKSKNKGEQSPAAHANDAVAMASLLLYPLCAFYHWYSDWLSLEGIHYCDKFREVFPGEYSLRNSFAILLRCSVYLRGLVRCTIKTFKKAVSVIPTGGTTALTLTAMET